jgi:Subtilase family
MQSKRIGRLLAVGVAAAAVVTAQMSTVPGASGAGKASPSSRTASTHSKLSPRLAILTRASAVAPGRGAQAKLVGLPAAGAGSLLRHGNAGRLLTYVRVADTSDATLRSIKRAGASIVNVSRQYSVVTVAVGVGQLRQLSESSGVRYVSEALTPRITPTHVRANSAQASDTTRTCGSVISEGDAILQARAARSAFDIDGRGATVGVLSDSYNTAPDAPTHARKDVVTGDLPGPDNPCGRFKRVKVLHDYDAGGQADEGRAMAQIVHDLAPGARLMFATAFDGEFAFANYIKQLYRAGATVIVDDVTYSNDPFYQRGPIGNAVRYVTQHGVVYSSSAGNSNYILNNHDIGSYDAQRFRPTACPGTIPGPSSVVCHSFDPSGSDATNSYTVASGGDIVGVFQSAQPRFGVTTNFDVYLLDHSTKQILAQARYNNIRSGDPSEYISWANGSSQTRRVDLVFARAVGTGTPAIRIVFWDLYRITGAERLVGQGSDVVGRFETYGHNADPLAVTTAAARWSDSATPEYFSSRGPVRWLFKAVNGHTPAERLPAPKTFSKPDVTATDGNLTTFFYGPGTPPPYRFYGTSAAAPHVAGVAALLQDLAPNAGQAAIRHALKETAADMPYGNRYSVGAGRVNAYAAATALAP